MTKTVFPQNPAPEPKAQKRHRINNHMTHTTASLATLTVLFSNTAWFNNLVIGCCGALRTIWFSRGAEKRVSVMDHI
jgi:hypothetical protein